MYNKTIIFPMIIPHPIKINERGGTTGFNIPKNILKKLKLEKGDLIKIKIYKEFRGKPYFKFTPQITQPDGSTGVTIPFWLVEELEIKKDDKYQAEFTDLEVGG